jgi:hypothetical protein
VLVASFTRSAEARPERNDGGCESPVPHLDLGRLSRWARRLGRWIGYRCFT